MTEEHRPSRHPLGDAAEERQQAEERLAYYARLEENTHDAFIATDERLTTTAWTEVPRNYAAGWPTKCWAVASGKSLVRILVKNKRFRLAGS